MNKLIFPLLVFLLFAGKTNGQLTVVQGASLNMTPAQLVQSQIVGQGVTISNATVNGSSALITSNQIGTFVATNIAKDQLKIDAGVIFTSGTAIGARGPNNASGFTGSIPQQPGDPDLTSIAHTATHDACIIEFDFIPMNDTLTFQYVFASEEFFHYCYQYNDAFGFFLSGPGITGPYTNNATNIALMPDGTTAVTIDNVCDNRNTCWDNCNGGAGTVPCTAPIGVYYQYNVLTNVFTATAVVQPCQTYHIKLAVADAGDWALDSGVFFKKNSFSAANLEIHTNYGLGQTTVEGCSSANVSFNLAETAITNDTIHYTLSGTATNGVDFPAIPPDYVVIYPGQDSTFVTINPFEDGLPEGTEYLIFTISVPSCSGMNLLKDTIYINDNPPLVLHKSTDTTDCEGTVITLHSQGTGGQLPYSYHWSTGALTPNTTFTTLPGVTKYYTQILDGCGTTKTDSILVTGKLLPVVTTTPLLYGLCSGGTTNIGLFSNPPGSSYSWTANCLNPLVTGYLPGSGNVISNTLINLSTATDTVKYMVTAVNNGCTGLPAPFKVGVAPKPVVTASPAVSSICSGTSCNITLSSIVPNVNPGWTFRYSSPFLSGATNGSGNSINQLITNSGTTVDTVIYKVVGYLNSCAGDTLYVKVIVMPPPVPTISGPVSICNQSQHVFTTQPGMTNYNWTVTPDGTILSGGGTSSVTIQWNTSGSKTVSVMWANSIGCLPNNPATYIVQVNPLPVISISGPAGVCLNSTGNVYTAPPGMTNYQWSFSAGGTVTAGGTTTDETITLTWNLSGAQSVILNYTDGNGCSATGPASYPVTVHPLPVPVITGASSVCAGETGVVYTTEAGNSNYVWQITGGTITSGGTGSNTATVTWPTAGSGTISVSYTDVNLCNTATPTVFPVTIKPLPDVIFNPVSPSICGGQTTNIALTSSVANPSFTWTATTASPTVTGYGPGAGNTIAQTLTTSGVLLETVTYHVTAVAASCTGSVYDVIQVVNPKPHLLNNPLNQTICSEGTTSIHLTSSCPGTQYTWTPALTTGNITGFSPGSGADINQTLTNLLPTQGEVQYTVSFNTGTCIGNDTIFHVFVNPKPHVLTFSPDTAICNGVTTAIKLNSDVANTTYTWTAGGSSANVTGFTAGTGSTISQVLYNTGFTDETVTYTITGHASGCDGFVKTYVVTVHPVADVYFTPPAQTICSGAPTSITLNSHVANPGFAWTATTSGNVTGFSSGSGFSIIQSPVNTGTNIETVTYTVTPTANGCVGTPSQMVVTVNPVAHVTNSPLAITHCSGQLFTFNLTSDVNNPSYAWTVNPTSPAITGQSAGMGSTISQTLSNSGFDIDSVIYTVTPTANGCTGVAKNYYAIINPVPDVSNNPLAGQICSGNYTSIALTSNVNNTSYAWTATLASGNISGFNNGNGLVINDQLVNNLLVPGSVVYHVTPTANSCSGPVFDYTETVSEVPDVYFNPPAQTVCSLQGTNIQVLSHVNGTSFTWTCTPSSAFVTGYANGSGGLIAQPLQNTGNAFETVTYTVTPQAFGCPPGLPQSVIVTVNPKPLMTNTQTTFAICSGASTNIQLTSTQGNATYTWTASGSSANVTGYSNSGGSQIVQQLTNTGFVNETVTYTVTPRANNCDGDPFNFTVTVYPVANVIFTPASQAFCTGSTTGISLSSSVANPSFNWICTPSSANVTGYLPGSGSLIQQTLFNSGNAIETVTYTVTPTANSCVGTSSNVMVTVHPNPVVTFNACFDLVTTDNAKVIDLKGATPVGGTYSGTGVSGSQFNPALAGAGTHTIAYAYSNTWGCNASTTAMITVLPAAPFTCGSILTDIRDNKSYPTIQIGTQCWMAANLNFGTTITSTQMQRDNCVNEKYCYFDTPSVCDTRGGLYQWDEMMQYNATAEGKGICPPAWHVPSENEWNTLFMVYIDEGFAGNPLKGTGYSGFNAWLFGDRFDNMNWNFENFATIFWSSSSRGNYKAWAHGMNDPDPSVSTYPANRAHAFSVRCIKD